MSLLSTLPPALLSFRDRGEQLRECEARETGRTPAAVAYARVERALQG